MMYTATTQKQPSAPSIGNNANPELMSIIARLQEQVSGLNEAVAAASRNQRQQEQQRAQAELEAQSILAAQQQQQQELALAHAAASSGGLSGRVNVNVASPPIVGVGALGLPSAAVPAVQYASPAAAAAGPPLRLVSVAHPSAATLYGAPPVQTVVAAPGGAAPSPPPTQSLLGIQQAQQARRASSSPTASKLDSPPSHPPKNVDDAGGGDDDSKREHMLRLAQQLQRQNEQLQMLKKLVSLKNASSAEATAPKQGEAGEAAPATAAPSLAASSNGGGSGRIGVIGSPPSVPSAPPPPMLPVKFSRSPSTSKGRSNATIVVRDDDGDDADVKKRPDDATLGQPLRGTVLVPCPARGMPMDHNFKSAHFVVPEDISHGASLVCSYEPCRNAGVKFRFCKYCTVPVAKRRFTKCHRHGEGDDVEDDDDKSGGSSCSGPQDREGCGGDGGLLSSHEDEGEGFATKRRRFCRDGASVGGKHPTAHAIDAEDDNDDVGCTGGAVANPLPSPPTEGVPRRGMAPLGPPCNKIAPEVIASRDGHGVSGHSRLRVVSSGGVGERIVSSEEADDKGAFEKASRIVGINIDPARLERWCDLLARRPTKVGVGGENDAAMSEWLMEVLAVSDTSAPLPETSSQAATTKKRKH